MQEDAQSNITLCTMTHFTSTSQLSQLALISRLVIGQPHIRHHTTFNALRLDYIKFRLILPFSSDVPHGTPQPIQISGISNPPQRCDPDLIHVDRTLARPTQYASSRGIVQSMYYESWFLLGNYIQV